MEIFKWMKEIEDIYYGIIDKAKNESLAEIKILQDKQKKLVENALRDKDKVIEVAIKILTDEVEKKVLEFDKELDKALDEIKNNYQNNKEILENSIIEKLGFDF